MKNAAFTPQKSNMAFAPNGNQIAEAKSYPTPKPEANDPVSRARYRVIHTLPYWTRWPKKLKRLYAMLDQYGSSDAAIEDMCEEFSWNKERIFEMIEKETGFKEALHDFRKTGMYAKKPNWQKGLTRDQLEIVIADEDALGQLVHIENLKAETKAGMEFALKRIIERGYMEDMKSLSDEAQQVLDRQEKVSGVPVTADEMLGIMNAGTESGLGWDIPDEEDSGDE